MTAGLRAAFDVQFPGFNYAFAAILAVRYLRDSI
jgi:hypothetical protein